MADFYDFLALIFCMSNMIKKDLRIWVIKKIFRLQSKAKYIESILGSTENLDLKKNVNIAFWLFLTR